MLAKMIKLYDWLDWLVLTDADVADPVMNQFVGPKVFSMQLQCNCEC